MHGHPTEKRRTLEPLDRALVDLFIDPEPSTAPARVLAMAPGTNVWATIARSLRDGGHHCDQVDDLESARARLERGDVDLVLLDPDAYGPDGLALLDHLKKTAPEVNAIVATTSASLETAVDAIRRGALDVVALPAAAGEVVTRVEAAVRKSRGDRQRDKRLDQLKRICKELNIARHEISKQVDVLCSDLASAYEGLAQQMNDVAVSSEFGALLRQELDVEDLLRTMLEYTLMKTGPTNAAVYLPDADRNFGLGAYVNYDCPDDSLTMLLDHLCQAVCPQMAEEHDIVAFEDSEEFAGWIGADASVLAECQVIAYACHHQGECLAVIVLFRREPFDQTTAPMLDLLRTPFADQLGRIVKIHHRAAPQWPKDAQDDEIDFDDEYGFGVAA